VGNMMFRSLSSRISHVDFPVLLVGDSVLRLSSPPMKPY